MRRRVIVFLYGCLLLSVACQRERVAQKQAEPPNASAATATQATATQATATQPQDLKNANINQLLPAAVAPVDKCLAGTALGTDGNVSAEQMSFGAADPIRITMWLKESPKGLQTSVIVTDAKKKEVAKQARSMNGEKVVTFTLDRKLAAGKYHVTGMWGGNVACERDIEVAKK
jgi:methionine-rich copper-binding protein CopC